jgi:hypothetical protein
MINNLNNVSRRDFMRVAGHYGLMSTLLGATGLSGVLTLPRLAEAANSTYDKRFKNKAKFNLKYGATGLDARRLLIMRAGFLDFVNDLEERTVLLVDAKCGGRSALLQCAGLRLHVSKQGVDLLFPLPPQERSIAARAIAQAAQRALPVQSR